MNKNILYALVFFVLFCTLVLPDILNPTKGLIFSLEEWTGLLLLLLGVLVFRNPIARAIDKLNHFYSWSAAPKRRIVVEFCLIFLCTALISFVIYLPTSRYIKQHGIPEFYQQVLDKTDEINAKDNSPSDLKDFSKEDWEFSDFMAAVVEGSFFCFLLIFVVEEIAGYINLEARKKLELQTLLKEQAQLRASVLQKQLDPHFMFNSLNVLTGLIYQDVDDSAQFIKELSKVYRYVLEQSEELVSTVEQEFQFLESYLYLLKIRFDDKIPVTIDVPHNRKDWLLPSMTLELLVENAIKHNIVDREQPLHLNFSIKNDQLFVRNNLQRRNSFKESLGLGLNNLKKRLELLGENNYSFAAEGNEFVATVPLINPEDV